ncbi:Bromodomain-containing protein [Aspergillus falconensis]
MPSLPDYTPLESLLFFQTLAAQDSRPTDFVSISDVLRNNKFVRENGAFDARRLTPEALEGLYSRLIRDGSDSSASTQESNGHHSESSPSNPKKRKIATPRPDGLSDAKNPGFVPYLVTHLYAKYKELVTKEIRLEEKRYRDIRDEIARLEKEVREAPREKLAEPATTPTHMKHEPAPEAMDLDTTETPVPQLQPDKGLKPAPIKPSTVAEAQQPQPELPRKDQPPAHITPQLPLPETKPPAQPLAQQPAAQKNLQPQPQSQQPQAQLQALPQAAPPPPQSTAHAILHSPPEQPQQTQQPQVPPIFSQQVQPSAPNVARQPQLPNGKAIPSPQKPLVAAPNAPGQDKPVKVPLTQPPEPLSTPVAAAPAPARDPVATSLPPSRQPQLSHHPQTANVPVASSTPQKTASTAKAAGKKGVPAAPARGPPQGSLQQWSLNQPQTPQHPLPQPSSSIPQPAGQPKPLQPPPFQHAPKVVPRPQPVAVPSTPQPSRAVFQTPAPPLVPASGFATPIGRAQGYPATVPRPSRPQLSIATPGSLTPWKQTPYSTLPNSPRSPDRPRLEDVSPISEKAPSPFGSRAATPEEPEPPRRKGPGRGRKKGTDANQGGPKKKAERTQATAGKKRDRSTASSRSRGRSILSRDDESGAEAGKIKREVPSTPGGVDSVGPERSSTSQKAPSSELRPGRGRPKRKRSELPESEAQPQSELSQLTHADLDQSAPFVLCTRNFPRTGAPIMNDVLTHKHASIFTKPLTERDAPGYRDLIYRPQDLKSIKSSISQGSKAVAAATEAANTPVADGESPIPSAGTPSKNAVLMLPKTEDVIPPRAIVNSAQLEKELIRMFTNAVMYNPIPQRGFGPAFPMAPDGGSGRRKYAPEPDDGGIIKDTLEMFEDVEQAVTTWRSAEIASKTVLSLRRESTSDHNMDSADDVKG